MQRVRKQIEGRQAAVAFLGLLLGLGITLDVSLAPLLLVLLIWLQSRQARLSLAACALLGLAIAPEWTAAPILIPERFSGPVTVTGSARKIGAKYGVDVLDAQGRQLQLYVPIHHSAEGPILGSQWQVDGWIRPFREDLEPFMTRRAVSGELHPDTNGYHPVLQGPGWAVSGASLRSSLDGFLRESLSKQDAATVGALTMNLDDGLSRPFKEALRRSGTFHIISASGLHVMVVAVALEALLRFLAVPRWAQLGILIALLALYAVAAGLQPPIVRSVTMAAILFAAFLFRRGSDLLSALSVAGLFALLWNPRTLLDIGFQLSFVTLTGIVVLAPRLKPSSDHWMSVLGNRAYAVIAVSAVASIVSAPLIAYHFGQISIVAPISNLAIAPLVPLAVVPALGGALLAPWLPGLCDLIARSVIEPSARWITEAIWITGGWSWSSVQVAAFSSAWLWVCAALGIWAWEVRLREG